MHVVTCITLSYILNQSTINHYPWYVYAILYGRISLHGSLKNLLAKTSLNFVDIRITIMYVVLSNIQFL